jgi:hypothetical protein
MGKGLIDYFQAGGSDHPSFYHYQIPSDLTDALGSAVDNENVFRADSLEELVEAAGLPKERTLASLRRYNEFARKGRDDDFGKKSSRLFALEKPPFYATKVGPAILAIPAGLKCDENFAVLDADGKPIEGLYVAGNMVGSVIAVDYPINVAGNSHGRCITFGYDLGKQLAGVYEPAVKPGDAMPGLKVGNINRWTAEGFPAAPAAGV